jgi:hypothetical protein
METDMGVLDGRFIPCNDVLVNYGKVNHQSISLAIDCGFLRDVVLTPFFSVP